MKKVYFACAVAGGRDYAFVYKDFVDVMKASDVTVLGDIFADPNLKAETGTDPNLTPRHIWQRDTDWLQEADAMIAEVSQPSLGVGYEIALAETMKKPVLVLFYKKSMKRFSPMIVGNPNVKVIQYAEHAEAKKAIKEFINRLD
jgi:hypothetical protein